MNRKFNNKHLLNVLIKFIEACIK